ncbi:FAD-binding oxidoreductase [Xenophilus sp. Marseille-Q4582]|uniref:FAD-binding oxidoreductase n=1 Tax=Xenophilus sp. Marseille-Q4582 TaxID=2866600 RepID=UPI001CE42ED2|nr:FAD-binding oxidoreductase [Xenophilus sp. Marseille-Q4582]
MLQAAAALPLLPAGAGAQPPPDAAPQRHPRVRPADPGWPTEGQWRQLGQQVGGRLQAVASPFDACRTEPGGAACAQLFESLRNPYFVSDHVALTQTLGWVQAWTSSPSVRAVAARETADVVAAVNFARAHRLRLVVKGGGHSYQGTSNAPDSLLVWTRGMREIAMHGAFVPQGCAGRVAPQRAVSLGAGALWAQAYDAVSTQAGGYVQGGGCMTVGVAGLVQSGGFGSFSRRYGLAAASLLEAEVVTADGQVRVANACTHPELFWGLKGRGGGSLGIVTRLTLRVHELPSTFGAVNFKVQARSPAAFRQLIGLTLDFCHQALLSPHWGEQLRFPRDFALQVSMVFQGLTRRQAQAVWQPLREALARQREDFDVEEGPLSVITTPARDFWAPTLPKRVLGLVRRDPRPGAPATNVYWAGDEGQVGQVLHGYESAWLPAALLQPDRREALADALFAATRHWPVSLHLNKGLAGAPAEVVEAARDTAMNPAVLDAFALAILGAEGPPAYPGVAGRTPDEARAHRQSQRIGLAMAELRRLLPRHSTYLAESSYFQADWQQAFWGANYPRLRAAKRQYDPEGLFFVHHGVGSEDWSADGFMPRT